MTPKPTSSQTKTISLSRSGDALGRVLVVDDHAQARESMSDVLRHAGYQVARLLQRGRALARMGAESYDVVITDLQMPGMSGLEFIRQLSIGRTARRC